uniref:Alpha/beta hydrolase fold-3 domain-containing protein n=1 Tax=Bionectria ochroleuca TaxID=29856 RepID=A0A8H7KEC9_BIOOC
MSVQEDPYSSVEAVQELANIDPDMAKMLKDGSIDAKAFPSFEAMVQMFRDHPPSPGPQLRTEWSRYVKMRDGHTHEIRVYKPDDLAEGPAIASLYGATVVNISYRLAPEFKFPTAPNDVWDSITWLVEPENAKELGLDLDKGFIVGGMSAGANLAAVLAQQWVSNSKSPSITGIWLNVPLLFVHEIVPDDQRELWVAREQNAEAMIISKESTDFIRSAYSPHVTSPDFSPANQRGAHTGLPPTHIQVCGQDPLRDDGLIYERILRKHGVTTKLDVYPGIPHAGPYFFPTLPIAAKHNMDVLKGFGWLLGRDASEEQYQLALETMTTPA